MFLTDEQKQTFREAWGDVQRACYETAKAKGLSTFHTLRDHYVAVYAAPERAVAEALAQFAEGRLSPLTAPTHASEAAGAPTHPARREREGPH